MVAVGLADGRIVLHNVLTHAQCDAAIAAFALGPGLGGYIFSGISRTGGANATNSIVAGTVGILILAVLLDTVLNVLTRLTTPRGIRV